MVLFAVISQETRSTHVIDSDEVAHRVQARLEKMQAHVVGLTARLQQVRLSHQPLCNDY